MSWKKNKLPSGLIDARSAFSNLPISTRLALGYTLSAFAMLAIVTAFLYWILIRGLEWDETRLVLNKVKMFEATMRVNGDNMAILDNEVNLEGGAYWPGQHYVVYSRILDERGDVIIEAPGMDSMIPRSVFPEPVAITRDENLDVVRYQEAPNGRSYYLMSALARSGGADGPLRVIQVAMDETGEKAMLAVYRRNTLIVLFLGTLIFAVVGKYVAKRCLRPVHDLARVAERITANNVCSKIDPDSTRWPEELSAVADSFYRMLFRLERSFKWCSQCTQDMAHELRNPINCLMGEAEVALSKERTPEEYRQVLESSLEEYARLSRMIKEFLFIARADDPSTAMKPTKLDVRKEIDAVLDFYDAQAQELGIELSCAGEALIDADPILFRQAISNLLANSLAHTSRGGDINLRIVESKADDSVEVSVCDNGCGIESQNLPRVFDRFYHNGNGSRRVDGAGLGLAIVKSIMTLHGGSVYLHSKEGEGTTATLRFTTVASYRDDDFKVNQSGAFGSRLSA